MNLSLEVASKQIAYTVLFLVFISCSDNTLKTIKYVLGEVEYECKGLFEKDQLKKILCLNREGVLIIEHKYVLGSISSFIKLFYDSGELKEEGEYVGSYQIEVWKSYYKNKELKEYRFYQHQDKSDSTVLIYKKEFSENGSLISSSLPVKVRTDSLPEVYKVGVSYDLFVDLLYSEFDSVNSAGILNSSPSSSLDADSTIFYGNSLHYIFTPLKSGKHSISGIYFEMDRNHVYENESSIAERPFKFEYVVE